MSLSDKFWVVTIFFKFNLATRSDLNLFQIVWAKDLAVLIAHFYGAAVEGNLSSTAWWPGMFWERFTEDLKLLSCYPETESICQR